MATPLATRGHLLASRGPPSRSAAAFSSSSSSSSSWLPSSVLLGRRPTRRLRSTSPQVDAAPAPGKGGEYRPTLADDVLLAFFRSKMVEEVGWDSEKPGYAGLMEVANRLMVKGKSALETEEAAVRVLQSLFPPLLLVLYKALLAPIANGQLAAMMLVNTVTLPDGKSWSSGVFVEKCKYLEESKCLGICINTCKLPTQTFFKDHMGVDLYMEPNFEDYSCQVKHYRLQTFSALRYSLLQFNFGVPPPPLYTDKALKEPCLDICTNARRRRELGRNSSLDGLGCPQV
nr:unnamed protein product [Digitaria exilis]